MFPVAQFLSRRKKGDEGQRKDVLDEEYEWVFGRRQTPATTEDQPAPKRPAKGPAIRPAGGVPAGFRR